jgi:hypothetical protein
LRLTWDEKRIWDCPAVTFHPELIDCVSHDEAESSKLKECAAGAQVLLDATNKYDSRAG